MRGVKKGSGNGSVLGATTTAAGVAILPNTGDNNVLFAVAIISIVIGLLVVATTVVRLIIVKKTKKQ